MSQGETQYSSVADYVREVYSHDGLEVESTGDDRIRVRMPPTFHNVTEFCRRLHVEFDGACVDLVVDDNNTSIVFEVYAPRTGGGRSDDSGGIVTEKSFLPSFIQYASPVGVAMLAITLYPHIHSAVLRVLAGNVSSSSNPP